MKQRYWQAEVGGRTLLYPHESTELGVIEHDGIASPGSYEQRAASLPATLVMLDSAGGALNPSWRPTLTVEYILIPEPATPLLLLAGGVLAMIRVRR